MRKTNQELPKQNHERRNIILDLIVPLAYLILVTLAKELRKIAFPVNLGS
jgi:hypothetical protein